MREAMKTMSSQMLRRIVRNKSNTMKSMRMLAYGTLVNRRKK